MLCHAPHTATERKKRVAALLVGSECMPAAKHAVRKKKGIQVLLGTHPAVGLPGILASLVTPQSALAGWAE